MQETYTCLDCGYVYINFADQPIKFCPECDSPNLTNEDLPICDICGRPSTTVKDIEIDAYAVLGICEDCRLEHGIEDSDYE